MLIIDEVLSVGDVGFQEKCVTRMRELSVAASRCVFVSHNLSAISALCDRAGPQAGPFAPARRLSKPAFRPMPQYRRR